MSLVARAQYIAKMTNNLPTLRAKLRLSQAERERKEKEARLPGDAGV